MLKRSVLKFMAQNQFSMMSGAEKLVQHLYENHIPMAIATNLEQTVYDLFVPQFEGLNQKYFSHYVSGANDPDVKVNKPAPDVYLVCAKRFNPPPKSLDNCVIFEDSVRGITGALTTGMKTVLINDGTVTKFGEITVEVTVTVDTLDHFKPESVGLPPYPKAKNN